MMESQFNFALVLPEIILLVAAMAILIIDAFSNDPKRTLTYTLSNVTLAVVFVVSLWQWVGGVSGTGFYSMVVVDSFSHFVKLVSYLAVFATMVYSREYIQTRDMLRGGEFYVLVLLALLGQMVMISAGNMLAIYLGLELMSLAIYALVAMRRDHEQSTEAAMKYFVLGSLASGFLLYGMSMVYGATGSLDLAVIGSTVQSGDMQMALVFGLVFIVAGLAFKLGVVPFHMWVPDVYTGAPTAVTLALAAAPKLAAFAIVMRLLVTGLGELTISWQPMLIILAVLSMAIGNLTALMQTNIKRMLAYSSISHMGFVLLALASGSTDGTMVVNAGGAYGSALFYMVSYVLTTLASFGVVMLMSRQGFECENLEDFKGLNKLNPTLAGVMLLVMFSLAGIPPLIGFYAKLMVLQAVIQTGMVWLAVVAVMFSLIGAFYYLRVVKLVYFDQPAPDRVVDRVPTVPASLLAVNVGLILLLGLVPAGLMKISVHTILSSF